MMSVTHTRKVMYFESPEELSYEAFLAVSSRARKIVEGEGFFSMAISGGESPRGLFGRFGQESLFGEMPWDRTELFWCDERYVSWDHVESNYGGAYRDFVSKVPIPAENVHRIPTECESIEECAGEYRRVLESYFTCRMNSFFPVAQDFEICFPRFDLVILGVGADGHTASLFPGDSLLSLEREWVGVVREPGMAPFVPRVSLTLPVLNAVRTVMFIVTGSGKRDVVRRILDSPEEEIKKSPAAMVSGQQETLWFLESGYRAVY